MTNPTEILNYILRADFKSFVIKTFKELNPGEIFIDGEYIDVICNNLQKMMNGEINRLIINIPPRYLKSIICSVALPAFMLGIDPSKKIMCISYGEELASKLALSCKAVMSSSWYKEVFPKTVINPNRSSIMDFETTSHGGRYATTMFGSITGRGADYILIDDPIKPTDTHSDVIREKVNDAYSNTIASRLNNKKKGAIAVIMQRLHENDLTGYLIGKDIGYEHIKLPLIAETNDSWEIKNYWTGEVNYFDREKGDLLHPQREGFDVVEDLRKSVSPMDFACQYQQNPIAEGEGIIDEEWLQYYESVPRRLKKVVISWDTASKTNESSSFSACVVVGLGDDDKYYLLDVYRGHLDFPNLVNKAREIMKEYERIYSPSLLTVLVEDASSGTQLYQELHQTIRNIESVRSLRNKVDRFDVVSLRIKLGELLFPSKYKSWYRDFKSELLAFPRSQFKDQCDALSQALNYLFAKKDVFVADRPLATVSGRP